MEKSPKPFSLPAHVPSPCLDPPGAPSSSVGPGARLPPSSSIGPHARLCSTPAGPCLDPPGPPSSPVGPCAPLPPSSSIRPCARLPFRPSRTLPGPSWALSSSVGPGAHLPPSSSVGPRARLLLLPSRRPATGPWHQLPEFPTHGPGCPSPPSPPSIQTAPCTLGAAASPSRPLAQGHPHVPCVPVPGGAHTWSRTGKGAGLVAGKGSACWGPGGRRHQPDVRLDVGGLQSAAPGAGTQRPVCVHV